MLRETIGGKRIGDNGKMEVDLHGYDMSGHDLSRVFRSTMAVGTLVPFFTEIGKEGDKFDIDLDEMVRTLPTVGPLFGSFKLQMEIYSCPIRLYNGALHNNALNIGMKMNTIKFPTNNYSKLYSSDEYLRFASELPSHIWNQSCLSAYLGTRDPGTPFGTPNQEKGKLFFRQLNSVFHAGYYDIFKNYHANKQEKNAYIIGGEDQYNSLEIDSSQVYVYRRPYMTATDNIDGNSTIYIKSYANTNFRNAKIIIHFQDETTGKFRIGENISPMNIDEIYYWPIENQSGTARGAMESIGEITLDSRVAMDIKLIEFPLENIDKYREKTLSLVNGTAPIVSAISGGNQYFTELPYVQNVATQKTTTIGSVKFNTGRWLNEAPMNGLAVKTYLSDLFNNWIQTDWIDGENGIAAITSVKVIDGKFSMDSFLLSQKTYNMMNRIAISGGTYDDWRRVTTGRESWTRAESPIYHGGASAEITFEEVISTAETEMDSTNSPLGTLAGKGVLRNKKGGKIEFTCEEPSIIIGIVSITPRLDYTQGNKWYTSNLLTLDDIHKPALDGIGYQDLILEQMDWRTTWQNEKNEIIQQSIGKQTAWINYMTAVNEAYGDFADENKQGFMILSRNYETEIDTSTGEPKMLDATTYINPEKFNYAFADTSLSGQNFWVQIGVKCLTRRIMSARQIPNL